MDVLIGPDVFVNASVALGSAPEQVARRVLGKPGAKPKTTTWVLHWVELMLAQAPGFKADSVKAQLDLIKGLVEVVEVKGSDEKDWTKGLLASAKATGLKRVMTDHPDLSDKTEVEGILFLSSDAWLLEATTPPPPPPPKK